MALFVEGYIDTLRTLVGALCVNSEISPIQTNEAVATLRLAPVGLQEQAPAPSAEQVETFSFATDPFEEFKGMDDVVKRLKSVVKFADNPDKVKAQGIVPVQGILLYGPSGVGKTALMRSLGSALDATIYAPSFSAVGSKYVGEYAANIQAIFEKARNKAGRSVIMLDEFDSLINAGNDEVTAAISGVLKQELEKLRDSPQVFFIAASNHVETIDPNIRASKRLQLQIPIGLPNDNARAEMFNSFLFKDGLARIDVDDSDLADRLSKYSDTWQPAVLAKLAQLTDNFSGGEIRALIMDAKRELLVETIDSDEDPRALTPQDIFAAIDRAKLTKA